MNLIIVNKSVYKRIYYRLLFICSGSFFKKIGIING